MTNLAVVESLKYGLKLFAYLLTVVVLGGGGMVLGSALAGPELTDGITTSAELFGGLVLAFLGLAVWVTGTFGIAYKLIADAVQWGVSTGTSSLSVTVPEEFGQPEEAAEPASTASIGPSPGEQTAREFGPEPTVPGAASVSDRTVERTADSSPVTGPTTHQQVEEHDQPVTERAETTTPAAGEDQSTTGTDQPPATNEATETQEPVGEQGGSGDNSLEDQASTDEGATREQTLSGTAQSTEHEIDEPTEGDPQPRDEHVHEERNSPEPADTQEPTDPPEPTAEEIAFGRNETDEVATGGHRGASESDGESVSTEEPEPVTEGDEPEPVTEGDEPEPVTEGDEPRSGAGEETIPTYDSMSSSPETDGDRPEEVSGDRTAVEESADGSSAGERDEEDAEPVDARWNTDETDTGDSQSEAGPDSQRPTDEIDFFASSRLDETAFESPDSGDTASSTETTADGVDTVDGDDSEETEDSAGSETTGEGRTRDPLSDPLDDNE